MGRCVRVVVASSLVLLGFAGAAAADSKVRGKVVGSDGTALGDARVTITDASSGRSYEAKTGKDGTFYQRGVLPGTYTLKVEKDAFTAHIIEEVHVQAGIERNFDVTLRSIAERSSELRKEKLGEAYATGIDAFQKGDYETALGKAEEAIAKRPEDPKGYDMKGKAMIGLKRYADAIPVLEKELTLEGAAADAKTVLAGSYFNAGVLASREGKDDETLRYWEKASELGFAEPQLDDALGRAYLGKQDFAKARARFESYLAKKPTGPDADTIRALLAEIQKLGTKK